MFFPAFVQCIAETGFVIDRDLSNGEDFVAAPQACALCRPRNPNDDKPSAVAVCIGLQGTPADSIENVPDWCPA